jgi:hypothetical protein
LFFVIRKFLYWRRVAEPDLRRVRVLCKRVPAQHLAKRSDGVRLIIFRIDRMDFGLRVGREEKIRLPEVLAVSGRLSFD